MKNRNLQFDIARVLAMLWIVGIWHLTGYMSTQNSNLILFYGASIITDVALATFMFISGFFLSKYQFETKEDIWIFYKKRLQRFYILFAMSAISMWLGGMNPGLGLLCTTLSGLSSYILPQPKTLWFFSMLFSFYILTPLIWRTYKRLKLSTLMNQLGGVLLSTLLIFLIGLVHPMDERLYWCFPCYVCGLVLGKFKLIMKITQNGIAGGLTIIAFIIMLSLGLFDNKLMVLIIPIGIAGLLSLSYWLSRLPINKVILFLSYSSMSMYLFHRHVFRLGRMVFCEADGGFPIWFAYIVMLPLATFVGYYIQTFYDKMSKRLF